MTSLHAGANDVRPFCNEPLEGDAGCNKRPLYYIGQNGQVKISHYGRQCGVRPSPKFQQLKYFLQRMEANLTIVKEVSSIDDEPMEGDAGLNKWSAFIDQKGNKGIDILYDRQCGIRPSSKFQQPRDVTLHVLPGNHKVKQLVSCDVQETRTDVRVTVYFSDFPEPNSNDNDISAIEPHFSDENTDGYSLSSAILDVTSATIFYLVLFRLIFTRSHQGHPTPENTNKYHTMKVVVKNVITFNGTFADIDLPNFKHFKSMLFPAHSKIDLKDSNNFSKLLSSVFVPQPVSLPIYPIHRSIITVLNKLCSGDAVPHDESMAFETLRLATFQTYPPNKPFSILFAKAGFYYSGNGDEVTCYCCGVRLAHWTEDDMPMDAHARVSPNCPFLVNNSRVNFTVTDVLTETPTMMKKDIDPGGGKVKSSLEHDGKKSLHVDDPGKLNNGRKGTPLIVSKDEQLDSPSLRVYETKMEATSTFSAAVTEQVEASRPSTEIRGQRELATAPLDTPSKYSDFAELSTRRASYDACTCVKVSKDRLAEAGFFYVGTNDCSRCFKCGVGLKDWEEIDDPWTEHAKHSNTCPFVLEEKGQDFVYHVLRHQVSLLLPTETSEHDARHPSEGSIETPGCDSDDSFAVMEQSAVARGTYSSDTADIERHLVGMGFKVEEIQTTIDNVVDKTGGTTPTVEMVLNEMVGLTGPPEASNALADLPKATQYHISETNAINVPDKSIAEDNYHTNESTVTNAGHASTGPWTTDKYIPDTVEPINKAKEGNVKENSTLSEKKKSRSERKKESKETRRLKAEKEKWEALSNCFNCKTTENNTLFLPCGHLVTCESCAPSFKQCGICGETIKGTVRTYRA